MSGGAVEFAVADTDTVRDLKARVFAANANFREDAQRIVYRAGPRGIEPLADEQTLGDACVARNGSAVLDVLIEPSKRTISMRKFTQVPS